MDQQRSKLINHPDRAIYDDGWIHDFLQRAPSGSLATTADGQPFLTTLLFVLDDDRRAIYIHKARRGRVWENIQANPRVCFSVSDMGRLLPADTALNFSVEYHSVVVFGTARLVKDSREAEHALQRFLDKYFPHLRPGPDYRPITPAELAATAVYRIDIEEWSGKQKAVEDDFPGAFQYGEKAAS